MKPYLFEYYTERKVSGEIDKVYFVAAYTEEEAMELIKPKPEEPQILKTNYLLKLPLDPSVSVGIKETIYL